jgi:hypothetical protein
VTLESQAVPVPKIVLDSVTHLQAEHRGTAALCASHGGSYSGYYAASKGVSAVILNDAGIGREQAGLGGVRMLEGLGVPAAAVSGKTARIGDGKDNLERGVLSFVNGPAGQFGLTAGMTCAEALDKLAAAALKPANEPPKQDEHRFEVPGAAGIKVVVMDSISLVEAQDAGQIIVTASHGACPGGKPEMAVKYPVFAAVTNDADRGIDDAGISRLPAMNERGIAGACLSAFSARIGDGRSMYEDGYVSALNEVAEKCGGKIGQSCRQFVEAMIAAKLKETQR